MKRTVVWFRRDLRVVDHEPLYRAARRGLVIPVFVFDRALLHHPETGAARIAFMLECLNSLDRDLQQLGGRLILRSGDPVAVLPELLREFQAEGIYAYVDCERIYGRVRDHRLNCALAEQNMKIRWFEPPASVDELLPYPHYRTLWHRHMGEPMTPIPPQVKTPPEARSDPLPTLEQLDYRPDSKRIPKGGTAEARRLLGQFLADKTDHYYWRLSYPSAEATSGLSPYIKFGAISVRECVQAVNATPDQGDRRIRRSHQQLIARLRWGSGFTQRFRYLPQLELRSLYSVFDDAGWDFDEALYRAWRQGQTGFPIVDAAARCLQDTGGYLALNFRSRAIYASFLSNLLGMDWRLGALHFMRHLIDGDCPIDHYQWAMQAGVTHCVDKSWTRIYNPGQLAVDRCDPDGAFIKKWVPELRRLSPDQLGSPPKVTGYPEPILDYAQARRRRIKQLETQRQQFRNAANIIPQLARLPHDLTPFGAERYPSEAAWAQKPIEAMFPAPLKLDALDANQSQALRTWFVAHVNITPPKIQPRRRRKSKEDPNVQQLSLLP